MTHMRQLGPETPVPENPEKQVAQEAEVFGGKPEVPLLI